MFLEVSERQIYHCNPVLHLSQARSETLQAVVNIFQAPIYLLKLLVADGWLVAYAQAHNLTLVTQEVRNPDIKKRVPIPNVCEQFNVNFINTFDMLRQLGVRFELAPSP